MPGQVTAISGWRFLDGDKVNGAEGWKASTRQATGQRRTNAPGKKAKAKQNAKGKGKGGANGPMADNGVEVFRAEMGSGISANPYLQFYTRAVASGELVFEWADDAGERGSERVKITVTG